METTASGGGGTVYSFSKSFGSKQIKIVEVSEAVAGKIMYTTISFTIYNCSSE
jgi:hypothetical protein